jgi:hypothetical protein
MAWQTLAKRCCQRMSGGMAAGRGKHFETGMAALEVSVSKQALQLEVGGLTEQITHLARSHGPQKRNTTTPCPRVY